MSQFAITVNGTTVDLGVPTFTISGSFRLTDESTYNTVAALYNFGSPIVFGVAPDTLSTDYDVDIVNDPTYDDYQDLPGIFTSTTLRTVLGNVVPTSSGSGTITGVSYEVGGTTYTTVGYVWAIDTGLYELADGEGGFNLELVQYTGDGSSNRLIATTTPLDSGVVAIMIFGSTDTNAGYFRHNGGMTGTINGATHRTDGGIMSFTSTGFTVTDNVAQNFEVNVNGSKYMALVFRDNSLTNPKLAVGEYTGDGVVGSEHETGSVTPTMLWIYGRSIAHKTDLHPTAGSSAWSNESKSLTNQITFFTSNSFRVGSDNNVNGVTNDYYWMAIENPEGSSIRNFLVPFKITGAGLDHQVTGIGFTPGFAGIKQYLAVPDGGTGWRGAHETGDDSISWAGSVINTGNIESFDSDGLTIGSTSASSGTDVYGVAFRGGTSGVYVPTDPEPDIVDFAVTASMTDPSGAGANGATDVPINTEENVWKIERIDLKVRVEQD